MNYNNLDLKGIFKNIPEEVKRSQEQKEYEQNEKDFISLKEGLDKGICYLCGKQIKEINLKKPCFHWFLNSNIKKKDFIKYLSTPISCCHLYTYLTWVANSDKPFVNINDLSSDTFPNRKFESSIRFHEFEWSFSLGKSDFEGHKNKKIGYGSHYHIQIRKNGQIFIKFNDTHIPFDDYDSFLFALIKQGACTIDPSFSAGIDTLDKPKIQEELIPFLVRVPDGQDDFRTRTYIDTNSINDINQINEIFQLYKNTNMTVPAILKTLNEKKGYNIKFTTKTTSKNNFEKSHRK